MTFLLTLAQQHRGQINGGAANRSYNGFGVRADHSERILKLLKDGEKSITEIAERLHLKYFNTQKQLARLIDSGKVEPGANGRKGKFFRLAVAVERNRNVTPLTYRHQIMREVLAKNEADRKRAHR